MRPTLGDRLAHIITAIDDIRELMAGRSLAEFSGDRFLRMAVERLFEIISEASRWIPDDLKQREADIAWKRMADLGNWLRHAYHRIDAGILFSIASQDLPPLKTFVQKVIDDERRQGREPRK